MNENRGNDILSARDWLMKADEDIAVAEYLLKTSKFYADVCFHCEQAAEKSLKAFLVYHRITPKKTHNLPILAEECIRMNSSLAEITSCCDSLSKLYIPTRYSFKIEFNLTNAEESMKLAKEVMKKIKEKIK